jgi:hypothetical protein
MTLAEFARWTRYLNGAIGVCLMIQLLRYGLTRRYCWLFCYLLAGALQILLVIPFRTSSIWYGYIYFGGQAVKAVMGVALATALWRLALLRYPALARIGRQIVMYMLLVSVAIAAAGLLLEPPATRGQNPVTHSLQAIEGAMDSMVLAFLVAMVLFLLWFPVQVHRNVAVCIGGFAFYMFHRWALLLLTNRHPTRAALLSAAMLVLSFVCLALWTLALRPEGEIVTTVTGRRWNQAEAERLLSQLDGINERMERIAKRNHSK